MKAAYTGWTWITNREPEAAKNQLKQAFQECKFLGYDTVENFAFIRDYYADDPQALVDLTKECGVDLVNLYGHFTFDVEEAIRIAKEQIDFCAAVGVKWYNCQNAGFGDDGPLERPPTPRCWTRCAMWPTPWAPTPRRRASPCASTPTTAPACSGRATSITLPSTPIPTTSPSALTPPTPPWPAWTPPR